jgi:hypothetical protein
MAGKIQDQDLKSAAELIAAGATAASLPNDTKIYVTANGINDTLANAITNGQIGSGGGLNYIGTQISQGATITGVTAYADAAGTAPVDGTGGAPASTIAVSTNSSLAGTTNLLWTKSAANRQGEGWSTDFTIDAGYQSKPFTISFMYSIASGTYADGDMTVWIYDKTNSVLIQPTASSIVNVGTATLQARSFQASSNSTSYRLIVHTSSTSASAYSLRFDSIYVSPNTYNSGAAVTAWQSYTPTFVGMGTVINSSIWWRRVGDSLEIQGTWTTGTVSGTTASMTLPPGLTLNNASMSGSSTNQTIGNGDLNTTTSNTTRDFTVITAPGTSSTLVYFSLNDVAGTTSPLTPQAGNVVFLSSTMTSLRYFKAPISGWGTSQVLSSDTDTRVVGAILTNSANLAISTSTTILNAVTKDTTGSYNASTGVYTVPTPGIYDITLAAATLTGAGTIAHGVQKNSGTVVYLWTYGGTGTIGGGATQFDCIAGDTIQFKASGSNTMSAGAVFTITRRSGPAQVAASEKVYCQYTGNAGGAQTADVTNIDFITKVTDSHGAWNGTTFTAPRPGWYDVDGSTACTTSSARNIFLWVNGSKLYNISGNDSSSVRNVNGGTYLLAGQTLNLRFDAAATLSNSATIHWISITSQG